MHKIERTALRQIKIGHSQFLTRPLRVKTGQYPAAGALGLANAVRRTLRRGENAISAGRTSLGNIVYWEKLTKNVHRRDRKRDKLIFLNAPQLFFSW